MMRLMLSVLALVALLGGCVSETVKSTSVPALEAPDQVTPASRPGGSVDRKRSAYFAAVAEHRLHSMKQESQNFVSVTEATREQPSVEVVA